MYRVTCTVAPTVSHYRGDWLLQRILLSSTEKKRGDNFCGCSIVCDSLSFPLKWATALSLSLFPHPPVSIFTSERWAEERVHFQKQGKGIKFQHVLLFFCVCVFICVCVSRSNTFLLVVTVIGQRPAESDKTSLLLSKRCCDMRTGNNNKLQHYSFYWGCAPQPVNL